MRSLAISWSGQPHGFVGVVARYFLTSGALDGRRWGTASGVMVDAERVHSEIERARAAEAAEGTRKRVLAVREQVRLRRERQHALARGRAGELGEDRQVGVQSDPLDAPDA